MDLIKKWWIPWKMEREAWREKQSENEEKKRNRERIKLKMIKKEK